MSRLHSVIVALLGLAVTVSIGTAGTRVARAISQQTDVIYLQTKVQLCLTSLEMSDDRAEVCREVAKSDKAIRERQP